MTLNLNQPLPLLPNQKERWLNFKDVAISFDEAANLVTESAQQDGERHDLGVGALQSWAFGPGPDGTASLAKIPLPGRDDIMVPLRSAAFGQLCSRIGAPAAYIAKLPAKLQMACVNLGMQDMDDTAGTLRLAGGEARALLSDRYTALDNDAVLETMRKSLRAAGLLGEAGVRSLAIGKTFAMRVTMPGEAIVIDNPAQVGDIVETGFDLLNGELGNRSISVTPITWRLVCTNGMRRADKESVMRMRHTGDTERLHERFADAVPAAIASGRGMATTMASAVDRLVDDILGDIGGLRAFGLGVADTRDVAREVAAARDLALPSDTHAWHDVFSGMSGVSAYDVMNGVTHVAKSRPTERRLEMEESALRYVSSRTR